MKTNYLSDDVCVVALAGLRCVTKRDDTWSQKTTYSLELDYKGLAKVFKYATAEPRDAMYARICSNLAER